MPLRVAMRADASTRIGAGHVARCLTLADEVRTRGGHVRLMGRDMPGHLRDWILRRGHEFVALAAPAASDEPAGGDLTHSGWLGLSQTADARAVTEALAGAAWDWLVVDHYALDLRWETAVAASATQMLVIDDLADRRHAAAVLLDQNLPADRARYAGLVPEACRVLLGPSFALVREEFRRVRAEVRPRDGRVSRVLVFIGGGDADNMTGVAVQACLAAGLTDVDVVIGATHPAGAAIAQQCASAGYRCHVQTTQMATLMRDASLAIGAAGSASWERCAVGLPTLAMATALNQRAILEGLSARGAVMTVAAGVPVTVETLTDALVAACRQPAQVRAVAEAAWALVDGLGVARVCDVMEAA